MQYQSLVVMKFAVSALAAVSLIACTAEAPTRAASSAQNNSGTDEMKSNLGPIIVEGVYAAPIAEVWRAITDPAQMPQWFFEPIADFEPRIGFETQFTVHAEGNDYLHLWKVTEVVPEKRIAYSWRYGGHEGESTVVWELEETPHGTKLTLTHIGTETFPESDPAFSREQGIAGWTYFIQESLPAYLQGQGADGR